MATVSVPELVKKVREIAEAEPERVYDYPGPTKNCYYAFNGKPSCIVGYAMVALGVPADDLEEFNDHGQPIPLGNIGDLDRDIVGLSIPGFRFTGRDEVMISWLDAVQASQDRGIPWGEAVTIADNLYPDA